MENHVPVPTGSGWEAWEDDGDREELGMEGNSRLITLFAALALLCLAAVGIAIARMDQPSSPSVISREVALGPDGRLSVQFVGDTMLGDAAQPLIDDHGYGWPLQAARKSLTADFVIAVAEAPISTLTRPWNPDKEYNYSTRPDAADALASAGIDAVTLANNHALDVGPVGLTDTIRHVEAAGMAAFGAGPDTARAEQPLLLRTELGTLGIVGMGEDFGVGVGKGEPGTMVFSPETIRRGADIARAAGADWVVADVHWGENYEPINGEQRDWAQQFADAGYDMVVGSGPHYAQPIEFIGAMPVVYSVGNFVFGSPGRFDRYDVPGLGLAVGIEVSADGEVELSVRCLLTDNDVVDFQPRPCTPSEAQTELPELHPGLTVHGDVGVLPCGCFTRREGE